MQGLLCKKRHKIQRKGNSFKGKNKDKIGEKKIPEINSELLFQRKRAWQ